jgi:hypothetical protein
MQVTSRGWARAFVEYSDRYVGQEVIARSIGLGVFQAETQTAWEYRADAWQRAAEASPDGCPIKGNINGENKVYRKTACLLQGSLAL